jgi:DNA-directed RNA polymerase I and III subunit RPAC1
VYVWNNTTVIADEILAHRLGLIPLNVEPSLLVMKESDKDQATDRNTVVFELQISCQRNLHAPKGSTDPSQLYINHELKSSDLIWRPAGEQAEVFGNCPPAPTNPDIVLTKLRPGQEVHMELHAVKGVGKDHAKYSPVATASYRLLPHITIKKPIPPQLAEKFKSCFSPGVVKIDPKTRAVSVDERSLRKDSVSREVLRHPEFIDSVALGRVRDFFLCKPTFLLSFSTGLTTHSRRGIRRSIPTRKNLFGIHQCHERKSCKNPKGSACITRRQGHEGDIAMVTA